MRLPSASPLRDGNGYVLAIAITALATGINALMAPHLAATNLVMVYLLGVAYVASRCSTRPAILASLLSVAVFDFVFVPPGGTFAVHDVEYVFTFAVMLAVSLLISTLTVRLREQSQARREAALHVEVEKMRGDLLSAVSHDLRTPLASIEGSAGALLGQPELSAEGRQLSQTIQEESARLGRLVRNLLDMTRVQGKIELELDWNGIDELVANAILRTESMFDSPVQLDSPPNLPPIQVDGVLIEQVFVNLLENAARHAGDDVRVEIRVRKTGSNLIAEFHDDGPGIEAGQVERIFDRFVGAKGKGSGLGLAISRSAVEAHGGRIKAENRPDRGATFTVELPLEDVRA